jgi:penicillin-binding protein 1A
MQLIISIFIKFINLFTRGGEPKRLFLFLGFIGMLNVFALVLRFDDWSLISTAEKYQIPSTLYGIGEKGEYEPVAEFYQFSKVVVDLKELEKIKAEGEPKNRVVQAFLSSEDNDFYRHFGLDIRGIARAFVVNIVAGRIKEGASTITQQLARLKFLTNDRSFIRKAREAYLAVLMEVKYPKELILEMYLNEIPLGHGTLGVGAAARFYFRKEIMDLSWGEAAMLASLTTRPREFSPLVNPNLSSSKVRINFMKLFEDGKIEKRIAEEEYKKFSDYYFNLNRSPNDSAYADRLNRFPYYTEYVRRLLSKKFTSDQIYNGGLKVYSSLVIKHQMAAEKALSEGLAAQTKISNQRAFRDFDVFDDTYGSLYELLFQMHDLEDFKFKISKDERTFRNVYQEEYRDIVSTLNFTSGYDSLGAVLEESYIKQNKQDHLLPVEGSILSMRPENGQITAIVGGSGFRSDNQQIRSFQAYRQPGSSFKPLVYATSIDYFGKNPTPGKNITAATQFADSPLNFLLEDGDEWSPENYSQEYSGFLRLRSALESSKNSVAIRVVEQIGLTNLLPPLTELLQSSREIPKNYSVALGTFEVTPYELTRSYAVFATGGKEVFPISILQVKDQDGKVLADYEEENKKKERRQLLSREASFIITSMMEDVVRKGTGKAVISQGVTGSVAGKTGTTNNFRDAWFVGFTPNLVASVWLGYDIGTLTLGRGMSGGVVATPIWGRFIAATQKGESSKTFDSENLVLEKIKVCSQSGKLPGPSCKKLVEEYFLPETLDPDICNDHMGYNPNIDPEYIREFTESKFGKVKEETKKKNAKKNP